MKKVLCVIFVAALVSLALPAQAQLISEFSANPPGTDPDPMSFEISGVPTTAFDGWVLSIECDSTSAVGTVDRGTHVTGTFDANGLLVVSIPDFENPSFTVILVSSFTGTVGTTDIDADNDGIADDTSTFGTVYDAIGVPDIAGDEAYLYGSDVGGQDFTYTGDEPEIIFRDSSIGSWYAVNLIGDNTSIFDLSATNVPVGNFNTDPSAAMTMGAINPHNTVPVELQSFSIE